VPSKQVIKILIEAEEEVSKVAKKAENALNKLGNVGKTVMQGISSASSSVHTAFGRIQEHVDRAREKFNQFINSSNKVGEIKSAISNVATSFGQLITNGNTAKLAMEKITSVTNGLKSKFTELTTKIRSFGSSAKASIDGVRAKLKSLQTAAREAGGAGGLGFLKNAASMTAGMIGYDLLNSVVENTKASLNARSSIQAFAGRLKMSAAEVDTFQKSLDDLQGTYKKIDMDVVGQQAEDMAFRLGLPKTALTELTETTAIFTDAMQRNGRSAEDSMLAMSDAMDGEFRRLKEIGISQEDLMKNGWSGDLNDKTGLLKAMNKALKEQHYDELAKSVDNLDDAWKVLSITLGNLLESILVPLTPIIVNIVSWLSGIVENIKGFVATLQNVWSNLPEWAQIGIAIAAIAVAIGVVIAAMGGLEAILVSILAPIGAFIAAFSWPLVAVVAAIGLVIAAIYEVGKAFGWWSDASSMIAAIGDGLRRLWEAFINHPDVQAVISAIGSALSWLGGAITWVGQQVLAFFGISTGSNWDIVRAIIDGIGAAWDALKAPIMTVITVLQALYNFALPIGQAIYEALKPIVCILLGCSPGIVPALRMVWDVFVEIWTAIMSFIGPIISNIVNLITGIIDAINQFKNGQMDLPTLVMTVLTLVWNAYMNVCNMVIQLILKFGGQLLQYGVRAGRNFLNGVVQWLSKLPSRAYSYLIAVVSRIISAGVQWVSNARQKASDVVTGVYNTLAGLPGQISSALGGVVSAITSPFKQAYDKVVGLVDSIKSKVSEGLSSAASLVGFAGSDAAGGETAIDALTGEAFNINTGKSTSKTEGTLNLNLNLENVPAHIDTETLIRVLTSKEVLDKVVGSDEFQTVDAHVKNKRSSRSSRARGV